MRMKYLIVFSFVSLIIFSCVKQENSKNEPGGLARSIVEASVKVHGGLENYQNLNTLKYSKDHSTL